MARSSKDRKRASTNPKRNPLIEHIFIAEFGISCSEYFGENSCKKDDFEFF